MRKIRLRTAWYALIFLASILPALVLAPWLSQEAHDILLEDRMLKEELIHKEVAIHLMLESKRLMSVLINKADPIAGLVSEGEYQSVHALIDRMSAREPMFNTITVYNHLSQAMMIKALGNHTSKPVTVSDPAFVIPMSGRIFLGSPVKLADGHFEFIIAVPLFVDDVVMGVLSATININEFWLNIKDATSEHDSMVYLVDGRGSLLTSLENSQLLQGDLLSDKQIVRSLLANKHWHERTPYIGFEGTKVFGIGTLVDNLQWGIISEVSEGPILASITPILLALSLIVLLLHIFFGLISLLFTGYLLNPISELVKVMQKAGRGDYAQTIHASQYHEVAVLSESFNKMLHEIDQRENTLKRMLHAMDHAGESVMITSIDGCIEYVNATFCKNTGYSQSEAIGKAPGELLNSGTHSKVFYQELWETIKSGKNWVGEVVDRKKDGSFYPVSMNISPVFSDSEITHFIAIQKDISDQRLLEDQLRQSQKMEAIGTLVGGIAHDFNNMLAGIMGSIFLAKKRIRRGEKLDEAEVKLNKAEEICKQAAAMISQLLTFARKGIIDNQELKVIELVKLSMELAQHNIPENVRVSPSLSDEPMTILGDATQLQQVILNLLNNANDAVSEVKAPHIQLSLRRWLPDEEFYRTNSDAKQQAYAQITVSDNGYGISQENLAHIYDPFFTTKAVGKGTGLGLSMVYGAVQNLSGYIDVESTEGVGTTFNLYFPTSDKQEVETAQEAGTEESLGLTSDTITILVADDDNQVRETTAEVLTDLGYHVLQAVDGPDAVNVFKKHKNEITIAVLDVVMPSFGGKELAVQLRKMNGNIPVIFVTGYDRYRVLSGEVFFNSEVLTKPVSFSGLDGVIRKMLNLS